MGRHAQGAAHREGARRPRRSNPRIPLLASEKPQGEGPKNVRSTRESIEVPTRHEEVSVERVLLSGEVSEAEIGEEEVVVPVELFFVVAASTGLVPGLAPSGHGYRG